MKSIDIKNLRSIKSLRFNMPAPGVHLLAGHNGAGKSSLLACLLRLGDSNAFPRFFRTSQISDQLDQFEEAEIKYTIDGDSVVYSYRGQRWVPNPKRNSNLLDKFGYGMVRHIAADAKRIEPRPEDFAPRKVRDASEYIRSAATEIFASPKFNSLKTINVRRGVGAEAFLFAEASKQDAKLRYFSERNFSLGELGVLKLLREIEDCQNGALLLIDELELALHPRAQVGLVRHLEKVAADKGLTVIFSTHSPSLIRAVARSQVLFLSVEGDHHECITGCYPAFALGQISVPAELSPDLVIYVEDDVAKSLVGAIIEEILAREFADKPRPTVVTIPVGGFMSVVRFLARAESILPNATKQVAFLDEDVKTESLAEANKNQKFDVLEEFKQVSDRLDYLPWTPEIGVCEVLAQTGSESSLRNYLSENRLSLTSINVTKIKSLKGSASRKEAKRQLDEVVNRVATLRIWDYQRALDSIARFFSRQQMATPATRAALLAKFMPVIRR
jgi:predicted ATPase